MAILSAVFLVAKRSKLIFQARKRGILDMDITYKKNVEQLKIVLTTTSPVQGMELSSKLLLQEANPVMVQGMD